ncbi:MAG: peptidase S41 [Mediterranea sp.]|jgi:C-terminal processing protease CtpA/Prc|nr:peptidase S41 [Mediterranea sp.]
MKRFTKKGSPLVLALALVGSISFSCGQDRWKEYEPLTAVDTWMYGLMQQEYLWYKDMLPQDDKSYNPFQAPATFLSAIRAKNDNVSFVDTVMESLPPSYGFDYSLVRNPDIDTAFNALVTYVIPHSPADAAGLKRGNWIVKVDTSYISKKYEVPLLQGTKATRLQMGIYKEVEIPSEIEGGEPTKAWRVVPEGDPVDMGAAEVVEDDPVHYHTVLELNDGSKVGYLMYSNFTAGTDDNPEKYNDELRAWSASLASQGVDRLILDLRYNAGGTIDCVQLLATLLAPARYLDQDMVMLRYSDKNAAKDATLTFDSQLIGQGKNLDLKLIYVLTGSETGGGAEMLMCGLNKRTPALGIVGANTRGVNVATERFVNEEYHWAVNPVVCTVYDTSGGTYASGYVANIPASATDYTLFLPFGDPREALLAKALEALNNPAQPTDPGDATRNGAAAPGFRVEKSVSDPASRVYAGGRGIKIGKRAYRR